jgi:NADH-quinone oxidoreductase E subunit
MSTARDIATEILKVRADAVEAGTALLPALHLAQKRLGWLSEEALGVVAGTLRLPEATVQGVASFYSMLHTRPVGRHLIQLCTNVMCMVMGSGLLLDVLRDRYGIEPNSTSPDGRFTLVVMECIGACGSAPAMLVDADFYHSLTGDRILEILDCYE